MILDKMEYLMNKYPSISIPAILTAMILGSGLIEVML